MNKRHQEKIWPFVVFFEYVCVVGGGGCSFGAGVANLQLVGSNKPEDKAEELERKDGRILGQ